MKNKIYNIVLLTIILLTAYCSPLNATVRFVSKTGNSIPPYLTWETASDSIQKCINICVFGDTIYVANGVYEEQIVMIPGLSLIGAGADSCEINTQPFATTMSYRSVIVNDTCLFKGFKIVVANNSNLGGGIAGTAINSLITENRIAEAKYGISNGSNATIYKNMIYNISTGMDLVNSNALVRNNSIYTDPNSQAVLVQGIQIEAFYNNYMPLIDSNYIKAGRGNGIRKNIGARPAIKNNVIEFIQYGADAIFLGNSDTANVYNNLIIIGTGYGGIYNISLLNTKLFNNYIVGNPGAYGIRPGPNDEVKNNVVKDANRGIEVGDQNTIVNYNNAWNNIINYYGFTPDTTNLSVDPMIVNDDTTQGELDFHLQAYSSLIDAGDPNILDRDGSRSDIGLYGGPYGWTYTYNDLAPRPPHNVIAVVEEGFVRLTWNKNTEADFSHYRIYRDTLTIVIYDSSKIVGETPDTVFYDQLPPVNGETRFYYLITAFDNQGNQSYPSEEIVVLVTGMSEYPPKGYDGYRLLSNYPNPFNPSTVIPYRLKKGGYVKLYVYDVKGELVRVLVNQWQEKGYYEVLFHPNSAERSRANSFEVPMGKTYSDIATGVYLYMIHVYNDRSILLCSAIQVR
ncbi:MAG: hypothetical protein OEM46_05805 [Ignavibacteria bacterium]|nr:hypothetical protein [Ignavibacteria bacterium]